MVKIEFKNNNPFEKVGTKGNVLDWVYSPNSKRFKGGGTMTSFPDGRTGKCVAVKTGKDQTVFFYSDNQAEVQSGKDTMLVMLNTKGKGTLQMRLYGYDPKKYCGGWNSLKIKVDSKDWQKQEFRIPLTVQPKTVAIRLAPAIFENSELLIDDLKALIERRIY